MNNDYSWLGLYQKGYKLQRWSFVLNVWVDIEIISEVMKNQSISKIRYKHSIQ